MLQEYSAKYYKREYNILKSLFHKDVFDILKRLDVTLAGGALTSLFSNREVNDLDLYFKSWDDIEIFMAYMHDNRLKNREFDLSKETKGYLGGKKVYKTFKELDEKGSFDKIVAKIPAKDDSSNDEDMDYSDFDDAPYCYCANIGMTDKSIMYRSGVTNGPVMQCIAFDVFPDGAEQIFKKFDFTINMGAFRFSDSTWVMDRDFMKHLAQKVLVVNPETDYPIISMLRASKYQIRGYSISRRETMKLGLAATRLKMESWDDAKAHLSGMYGTNVEKLFDEEKPFSFDLLFDKLDNAGETAIASIATEKEKKGSSLYNLEPVTYFEAMQRLRKNTGRKYFDHLYGVCASENFYLMTPQTEYHKVHLMQDSKDGDAFYPYIKLFTSLEEAEQHFDFRETNSGNTIYAYSSWRYKVSTKPGACLLRIGVEDPLEILMNNDGDVHLKDQEDKTICTVLELIKTNGEVS